MADSFTPILVLRQLVGDFVNERDWTQFHNPKDLASAIAIEASELMELFLGHKMAFGKHLPGLVTIQRFYV